MHSGRRTKPRGWKAPELVPGRWLQRSFQISRSRRLVAWQCLTLSWERPAHAKKKSTGRMPVPLYGADGRLRLWWRLLWSWLQDGYSLAEKAANQPVHYGSHPSLAFRVLRITRLSHRTASRWPMSWTTEAALIMCQRLRTHLVTYMSSSSARVLRCKLPTDLFLIEIRLGPLMGAISLLFEIGPVPMTWHR